VDTISDQAGKRFVIGAGAASTAGVLQALTGKKLVF
jgi:hypothetical protein